MRRALPLLLVLVLSGCDALVDAFLTGYEFGYGTADAVYVAAEERADTVAAWRSSCDVPVEDVFDTADDLAAADAHCRDRSGPRGQVAVCSPPGEEPGSHPFECDSYHRPLFFFVGEWEYRCPAGVGDGLWCLCCDAERTQSCGLRGDACTTNADCCEGGCSIDSAGDGECL